METSQFLFLCGYAIGMIGMTTGIALIWAGIKAIEADRKKWSVSATK